MTQLDFMVAAALLFVVVVFFFWIKILLTFRRKSERSGGEQITPTGFQRFIQTLTQSNN